ncbi:siderophore-interacting protein [Streptomyces sp. NPDC018031]|uniref:siderophore-interacting protein n=1 Tax=Streptomyces sp. NPDC018031 TaxID=3365033 RepID=UPI0037B024D2
MTTAATSTTAAAAVPFRFFDVHVVRTRLLGRSMVRITFGGAGLTDFASGGRDQRFKLFLPHPGQDAPVVPTEAGEDWFPQWRALDPATRGIMRSYTVRAQRRTDGGAEVDVDFALHGADATGHTSSGPAARWAARAGAGDRAVLLGPVEPDNAGVDFRPPAGTDWVLLTGDETALPAVAGILEALPDGTDARVWIEVPHPEDIQQLDTGAQAEITWLVRDGADGPRTGLIPDAVRAARLPDGTGYAWIAGEAGTVRALRRHLVGDRGFDRKAITFTGYWRKGATEEQLVEEALSGTGPADD